MSSGQASPAEQRGPEQAAQRTPTRGDAGAAAGPSSAAHAADATPSRGGARGGRGAGEKGADAPLPQTTVQKAAGIEARLMRAAQAAGKARLYSKHAFPACRAFRPSTSLFAVLSAHRSAAVLSQQQTPLPASAAPLPSHTRTA